MDLSPFETFLLRTSSAVVCRIFQQSDIMTLVALSRASRTLHAIHLWFAEKAWDPSWRYRQYFVHVQAFRRMLRQCDALISGSFVLQFFDRRRYVNSDLDIFLRSAGANDMCNWLKKEGYKAVDGVVGYNQASRSQHVVRAVASRGPEHGSLLGVYTFQRLVATAGGHVELMRVQVIVVDTSPIEHILFEFHSTAVMNFLSADEAISVFPLATFRDRTSFISHLPSSADKHYAWKRKYRKRGFNLVGESTSDRVSHLPLGFRTVGDKYCWSIKLRGSVLPDGGRGYYNNPSVRLPFDVLSADMGAVSEGCSIKIAEPYLWRCVACNPF
ncbi:hypothetical protein CVT26_001220 [Gymnopilus dilepis]|uniref:Uncharacterized protein n=1 Tax=Gymnopilus dilepis TaxID=231916 RepID=A0A409X5M1_9AGAR|nr:hypothetical protein CVT26_001220 [Gymnopilus dilepis]